MKKLIFILLITISSSCASLNKTAGYGNNKANVNTDWKIRKL